MQHCSKQSPSLSPTVAATLSNKNPFKSKRTPSAPASEQETQKHVKVICLTWRGGVAEQCKRRSWKEKRERIC